MKIGDSEIGVSKTNYIIGSDSNCDYVYSNLSPKHLSFSYLEGKWILNAISEIKLNDNKFEGRTEIKNGDIIEVADLKIEVVLKKLDVPYFRIILGYHASSMIKLEKSGVIGRDVNADYIVEDEYVSRRHAKIEIIDGKILWQDLQAKNPTIINGKVYKTARELRSGDEIVIGKTRLLFVNPKEKPEYEIYKIPSRRPLALILAIIVVLLTGIFTYSWTSNRINNFYYHYNNAKESLSQAFESNSIEKKISLLKYAIYELDNAKKNSRASDIDVLRNLASERLKAWEEVLKAREYINKGKLDEAKQILKNLENVLGEDRLFSQIYGQVLKARVISEYVSVAKVLKEQGREEEAKKLLEVVESKIEPIEVNIEKPEVPIVGQKKEVELSTKVSETSPQLKPTKIKEPSVSSDIKIDIPELGKIDIKPEAPEQLTSSGSASIALKLKELYEEKGDLEETIKFAMDILKNEPNNASAEFYLKLAQKEAQALQLEKDGRYKEAMSLWSEILRLDPDNIRAKRAIARLGSKI